MASIINNDDARALLGVAVDDAILPAVRPLVEKAIKTFLGWNPARHSTTAYFPKTSRNGRSALFPATDVDAMTGVQSRGGDLSGLYLDDKFVIPTGLQVWEVAGSYMGQVEALDDELEVGVDFVLDLNDANYSHTGKLIRLNGSWPRTAGSVKVTYTAGFTDDELKGEGSAYDASDIRLAVIMALQKAVKEIKANQDTAGRGVGLLTSESIEGYSYTVDAGQSARLVGLSTRLPSAAIRLLQPYRRYYFEQ